MSKTFAEKAIGCLTGTPKNECDKDKHHHVEGSENKGKSIIMSATEKAGMDWEMRPNGFNVAFLIETRQQHITSPAMIIPK